MEENNKTVSGKLKLPDDTVLVKQMGAMEFYFSKAEHAFFVAVSDYHSGPVKLLRAELLELLNIFDKQTEEKETELLSELESDEDDF